MDPKELLLPPVKTMKAVVWEGKPYHMSVKEVPRPVIQHPSDVIIQVTTAAICGSYVQHSGDDLHIYHGIGGPTDPRWNMGHEAVGVIVEVGSDVPREGATILHDPASKVGGGVYGNGNLLGVEDLGGCQAEFVRLPLADRTARKIPDTVDKDNSYVLISDIWCTAWVGITRSGFQAGDTVVVFGCGPVGLLGQYSALFRGAARVYAVDHVDSRLAKAQSIGAIPIDLKKGDPATQILKLEPAGVNRAIDMCGFECVNAKLEKQENYIVNQAIEVTATGGGVELTGVYYGVPPSKGSPDDSVKLSYLNINYGSAWSKNITISGGFVIPEDIQSTLIGLIQSGKADPSFVVDRVISIDEAPEAYKAFSEHKYGKTLIKFLPNA